MGGVTEDRRRSRLETCTTLLSKMGERDRERDRERITEIVGRELGEIRGGERDGG